MAVSSHPRNFQHGVRFITDEEILRLYYEEHWFKNQICHAKHVSILRVRQVIRDAETRH
jgi:hypothetical protein